jgi:Phage integrase family
LLRKQNKTLFVITKTEQTGFPEWGAKLCSETINYDHRGNSRGLIQHFAYGNHR